MGRPVLGTLASSQVYVPTSWWSDVQTAIEKEGKVAETVLLAPIGNGEIRNGNNNLDNQTMPKTCLILNLGKAVHKV